MTSTRQKHHRAVEPAAAVPSWVRVWFGSHVVREYTADPVQAERYAEAMRQRFRGLKVTIDPVTAPLAAAAPRREALPSEWLWELTP